MKKIEKASTETIEMFQSRINHLNYGDIKWTVHNEEDMKITKDCMCGKVLINNPHVALEGHDVIFVINEDIFDSLLEEYQVMIVDKLLAQVQYDMEKGKISKGTPDIQEFSGLLLKYGTEGILNLRSEIKRVYEKAKTEDDEKIIED